MRTFFSPQQIIKRSCLGLIEQAGVYLKPASHHMPEARFFIFGQGRSGTTLLQDLFNSYPDIQCDGEILYNPVFCPYDYVERRCRLSTNKVYGFKVKNYQLAGMQRIRKPKDFLTRLSQLGWKIVFIKRENFFRHAISFPYIVARKKTGKKQVVLDPEEIFRQMRIRRYYGHEEDKAARGLPVHRIVYERDLLDPAQHQPTMDRAFAFLGLDAVSVQTTYRRKTRDDLSALILNYDQLRQRIQGTEFEEYLDE